MNASGLLNEPITAFDNPIFAAAWPFLVGAVCLILFVLYQRLKRWGITGVIQMLRRRAAFVIVLGLGLIAFDRFTAREVLAQDEYFLAAHHAGWIALGGAVMTLIGIYHWITGPTTPEI